MRLSLTTFLTLDGVYQGPIATRLNNLPKYVASHSLVKAD